MMRKNMFKRGVLSGLLVSGAFIISNCSRPDPTLDDFQMEPMFEIAPPAGEEFLLDANGDVILLNEDEIEFVVEEQELFENKKVKLEPKKLEPVQKEDKSEAPLISDKKIEEKKESIVIRQEPVILKEVKALQTVENFISSTTEKSCTLAYLNSPFDLGVNVDELASHIVGQDTASYKDEAKKTILKQHAQALLDMKKSYEDRNLIKMRLWRDEHLIPITNASRAVFYPFSGPDVVNVLTFYPSDPVYVMIGQERVGNFQGLKNWNKELTDKQLKSVRKGIESLFVRSYFKTLDMSSDFSTGGTDGIIPGVLVMLKLMNKKVLNVQWVSLNDNGQVTYVDPKETAHKTHIGVEFTIQDPVLQKDQKIYYFREDLSNKSYAKNQALQNFLRSLGNTNTLVKSASYLMHMKEFTEIRGTVLGISKLVVQDDTGVPFKNYLDQKWKYLLFGDYSGPYGDASFTIYKQPQLLKAYKEMAKPMNFRFGYGYSKIPSHLLILMKD